MVRAPARTTYAKLVGEIAIGWNQIEREMNNIAFHYLTVDSTVAGFILSALGNQTKADFILLLARRFEKHKGMLESIEHSVSVFNRLRENRNILEHAIPDVTHDQRYLGRLAKLDKTSNFKLFEAPISTLVEIRDGMNSARAYSRALRTALAMLERDREPIRDTRLSVPELWLSSLDKPSLPRKISPLELQEAPTDDPRPPRS